MGARMKVSACLVSRGDVEMQPIIDSLPNDWQIVIWNNGEGMVTRSDGFAEVCHDLSVFGRYAAIEYASHDVCYVQDDDVIVSDPQVIVDTALWQDRCFCCDEDNEYELCTCGDPFRFDGVVCNQPKEFRHDFYSDHSLVGFGSAFHRDAPERAFDRFLRKHQMRWSSKTRDSVLLDPLFTRCCDIVFTGLTPCVQVDVPKENLPYAYSDNRMWKQPTHQAERQRMLDLVRRVRDGE